MKRLFKGPRLILWAILLVGILVWGVPAATEGWGRDRLIDALQKGLGRKVEVGQVHFRVFPTPGFAINDVRIGEDPSIGPESCAYVDTLVAMPRILSSLGGDFAVASVRLEDASINLTRVDTAAGVRWNFASLGSGDGKSRSFPAVHMAAGRINFKFGDTKSIFYLEDTDVDLATSTTDGGLLKLRIAGQPARTDRPSRGFGSFVASGEWNPADRSMQMDLKLEKSEVSDLMTLFEGSESGLLGQVWGDAHFAGPIAKIGLTGRLNVAELHGWNQLPPSGEVWPLWLGGTLNAADQSLALEVSGAGRKSPIDMRLQVADYLGRPRWTTSVNLDGVPVAPLTQIARNFGIAVPADLSVDGVARGALRYSNANNEGMQGGVEVLNAAMTAQGAPPLKIARADVKFTGSLISLSPTPVINDAGETADIDAEYDVESRGFRLSLNTNGMAIASLRRQISVAGVPILGLATAGQWSGSLRYATPDGWSGQIQLRDADIPFEAFAQPIHVSEADAAIDADGAIVRKVKLSLAGIVAQGDYRYEIGAPHPHRFHMTLSAVKADALETVLLPTLERASMLTYAFNFGRVPAPDWLTNMHAEGAIQAASVSFGDTMISGVKTNVVWDGTQVKLQALSGRVGGASLSGTGGINLAGRLPRYDLAGDLAGLPWQGGVLSANGQVKTYGTGLDLLANLHAEGTFGGKRMDVGTLGQWESLEGQFDLGFRRATPRLRLSPITIQSAGAKWTGAAETQDSGLLVVKLADGSRKMEATGAVLKGETLKTVP